MNGPIIGFAGLTHLGIISSVGAAAKGCRVIGFHDDTELISKLNSATFTVQEPQLLDLFRENRERITFTADIAALSECHIVYISIDIPTNENGKSDLKPIQKIISQASNVLQSDTCLVILSQVSPGFTRQIGLDHKRLFYQVETLIFGGAIERAMRPERFIVGCDNPSAPLPPHLLNFLNMFNCPILQMRYESAELAKISINICLVASISATNTLAEICEKIGADWSEIMPALRLDKRIGQYAYLNPGLGISGGNLERDLATVLRYAEKYKTDGGVVASWVHNSQHRKEWAWTLFKNLGLDKEPEVRIAVLGLTYKENTHSIKNSPSLVFLGHLTDRKVTAYDPAAAPEATPAHVYRTDTAIEAIKGADVLAIMTPWPEFRTISAEMLSQNMTGRVVFDPYRMLDYELVKSAGLDYYTLGMTPEIFKKENKIKS